MPEPEPPIGDGPRHPRLIQRGGKAGDTDLPSQFDRLREVEWDVLVVLDAVRWDFWQEHIGDGEAVRSSASCTKAWVANLLHQFDLSDVACITANPEVTRRALPSSFAARDDLWERKWTHINGLGTVEQEAVTEAVEAELTVGPDRRVYCHYPGCHGPYPMHDPPIPVMRNNPEASAVEANVDLDDYPDEIIMDPSGELADPESWLTVEMLRDAYVANLEWAWAAIQPLLDRDATVVVTADHGEFLGETVDFGSETRETFYGHPCPVNHPILREVSFAVY